MSYFLYFPFGVLIFFLYLLPGFLVTRFKLFNNYNELQKIALSYLISSIIFISIGCLVHLFGFAWSAYTIAIPTIALISVLLYLNRNRLFLNKNAKNCIFFLFLIYIVMITFQIFVRYYPLGRDWMWHFDYAGDFLSKDWVLRTFRTPLYNFIVGFFLSIFGNFFWVAQLVTPVVSIIYLIPSYLIAKDLFNRKVAYLTLLILVISPFMVESALYTYPKNFTAFFILLCLYFIVVKKLNIWFGVSAALAFLTHFYSLFFLIPFAIFIVIKRREFRLNKLKLLSVVVPLILTFLVFYGYNIIIYGELAPDIIKYFPFAIKGWVPLFEKSPEQIWNEFYSYPFYYHVFVRIINFIITFVPFLVTSLNLISKFMPLSVPLTDRIYNFSTVYPTYDFLQTFPGALSLLLFFFFLIGFKKLFKEHGYKRNLIFLTCLPIVLCLALFGWIIPVLSLGLHPLVPLFAMIGFWAALQTKTPKKWIKLIFLIAIIEAVIFPYLYLIHINSFTQEVISWGQYELYEKYFSAYKLFRGN